MKSLEDFKKNTRDELKSLKAEDPENRLKKLETFNNDTENVLGDLKSFTKKTKNRLKTLEMFKTEEFNPWKASMTSELEKIGENKIDYDDFARIQNSVKSKLPYLESDISLLKTKTSVTDQNLEATQKEMKEGAEETNKRLGTLGKEIEDLIADPSVPRRGLHRYGTKPSLAL